MATTRTINSPGVQITETDLSRYVDTLTPRTTIFVPGFAAQGPTDEILSITSISELETVYGKPETAAERYFHYSCREIINTPATLLTTRLPYGSGSGADFANQYSALLYPTASAAGGNFTLGRPVHVTFQEGTYQKIQENQIIWGNIGTSITSPTLSDTSPDNPGAPVTINNAGLIILNTSQTTVNELNEGYYVAITDNKEIGPDTDYTAVTRIFGLSGQSTFAEIPTTRLGFQLSAAAATAAGNSISESIETVPTFFIGKEYYNDTVIVSVFKVRNSIYEPTVLAATPTETYIGSFNPQKYSLGESTGGAPELFFLENRINRTSSNIKAFVNRNLQTYNWNLTAQNVTNAEANKTLNALGVYSPTFELNKYKAIGEVSQKIDRALTLVDTPENVPLDVVVDAGLSTIYANASGNNNYDDTIYVPVSADYTNRWKTVFNKFNNFVQKTRRDCMFISDPLRQIFVQGENTKTVTNRNSRFSTAIYLPLKDLYGTANSNYSAAYGNWVKQIDQYTGREVWLPASAFAAACYARTDFTTQPWIAPAGFNRGVINSIIDIAFNPNQKQRDDLYTISINPLSFFPNTGFALFGQKTLQNDPSAFDRINVRRLFLSLEKATLRVLKFFVFEPNTEFTRTRVRNTLFPIFENAKNTEGLYDFLLVCDERNNTADTVDRSELIVDIYLKPVKAAEFILVNFIATRTGQDFNELIG